MSKRELALDLPAIRERVAAGEEMWLGLSRDEAELLLAEIDRTAAALAAVEQDRDKLSDELRDATVELEQAHGLIYDLRVQIGRTFAQRNAARSRAHQFHEGYYDQCLRMPCRNWRAEEAAENRPLTDLIGIAPDRDETEAGRG